MVSFFDFITIIIRYKKIIKYLNIILEKYSMTPLKIISYNISALPKWFNLNGNPLKRIEEIIDLLIKNDADVICLQEVFDIKIKNRIAQELLKYDFHYKPSNSMFCLSSGLMILSKYRIISKGFEAYNNYSGEDSLTEKGILYITIKINNTVYTILNTHLNANAIFSLYRRCVRTREKQMHQLLEFIKNRDANRDNIILCGDFNIDLYDYQNMFNKLNNIYKFNISSINFINNTKLITFSKSNKQLDYIFYFYNTPKHISFNYELIKSDLSDHYPIILNLLF
jgi:exonuclease III